MQEGFDYADELDPLIGIARYSHLLPRTLLTHKVHLATLTQTLATAAASKSPVHPVCHPLLLSALASRTSGGLSPLRVLPPPASMVDRVDDCRSRNWADVHRGLVQVGDHASEEQAPPSLEECVQVVDRLLGGGGEESEEWEVKEWLIWGEEVGTAGPLGVKSHTEVGGAVEAERWQAVRRREACMKV